MSNPTDIVEKTSKQYAHELGMDWDDDLTPLQQQKFRALAFKIYELHVQNKLQGMQMACEVIEDVQTSAATPKNWLRGVQEAKNALVVMLEAELETLEVSVEVPDAPTDDLDAHDKYETLEAGDKDPYDGLKASKRCGAVHDDNWTCTREKHPEHWQHWDSDPADFYRDTDGEILVTWRNASTLDSVHRAVVEYEGYAE